MERIVEFANRLFGLPDELEKLSGKSIDWIKFSILTFLRKIKINKYSLKPFDKYKCIFIHIPRTGGVSLTKSLFNLSSVGHFDIQTYQKTFSEIEFNSYFKFTFVRNPWDRLVSAYEFLKAGGMHKVDKMWADLNINQYKNFDSFVKGWLDRKNIYSGIHFIPQYKFISINNSLAKLDFVGHFENFDKDFNHIKNKLCIKSELLHLNDSNRKEYKSYYTQDTIEIVAKVYREDINMFGYDFENSIIKIREQYYNKFYPTEYIFDTNLTR